MSDEDIPCPEGMCGNESLDETPDDAEFDYFCHWCGALYLAEEVAEAEEASN